MLTSVEKNGVDGSYVTFEEHRETHTKLWLEKLREGDHFGGFEVRGI